MPKHLSEKKLDEEGSIKDSTVYRGRKARVTISQIMLRLKFKYFISLVDCQLRLRHC